MQIATKARQAIWGLTPEEQRQKSRSQLRSEMRKLERNQRNIKDHERKSVDHLHETSKKLQKMGVDPSKDPAIRKLALGVVRARTQQKRLATSSAKMKSIMVQFNQTRSLEVMEESMKQATGIMKSTSTQVKIPEMMATTRNFDAEQMKAETYEEMVDDMLDPIDQVDGVETEDEINEVNQLLNGILKGQETRVAADLESPDIAVPTEAEEEEDEEKDEEKDEQMLGRMQALRSS